MKLQNLALFDYYHLIVLGISIAVWVLLPWVSQRSLNYRQQKMLVLFPVFGTWLWYLINFEIIGFLLMCLFSLHMIIWCRNPALTRE